MSEFGDTEPEDAWDASDPIPDLLGNLERRIALLVPALNRIRHDVGLAPDDIEEALDLLAMRLLIFRRRRSLLDQRELTRVNQLIEDIAFLRSRNG